MLRPVRVTPPAARPVSVAEARAHLRVDDAGEEAPITALLDAAVSHLDGWTGTLGRCLVSQRWRQDFTGWWDLRLAFPMAAAVVVTYRDSTGTQVTVDPADFRVEVDELGPRVIFGSGWSSPSLQSDGPAPVTVEFDAGFGDPEDVPAAIKRAILMLVGHWYANREAVGPSTMAALPMAVAALLAPWRVVRL